MQLNSWLQEHPDSTKLEIDNILDGNICRLYIYKKVLFFVRKIININGFLYVVKNKI